MDCKKIAIAIIWKENSENVCAVRQFVELLHRKKDMEIISICLSDQKKGDFISEIKTLHPDLLITVDLQGFEQSTLTDSVSYNLLDCKQLHLLLHERLSNELYLDRQLSIAMFFYCVGNSYYEYLKRRYTGLPYLKMLPGWQTDADKDAIDKNVEALYKALEEVLVMTMMKGNGKGMGIKESRNVQG